jgi:hypothetical protein
VCDYASLLIELKERKISGEQTLTYTTEEIINLDVQRTFFESNPDQCRDVSC